MSRRRRSAEVLRLDVEDLDMPNRRARVRRKGGAIDAIIWQTRTARLLPRLLNGRKTGPLFVTDRAEPASRSPRPTWTSTAGPGSPTSKPRCCSKKYSGGATLHQLRHSALSHDAEAGTGTPMLMARSGHTSVRVAREVRAGVARGAGPASGRTRPRATRLTVIQSPGHLRAAGAFLRAQNVCPPSPPEGRR